MASSNKKPINTVRLNPHMKQRVLDEMDRAATEMAYSSERRTMRVPYRHESLVVCILQPDGSEINYSVAPRNLSTMGLGFLHGTFVYPGCRATVEMLTISNKLVRVDGKVVNCRHVSGNVHEVGVSFDNPIDITEFVELSADDKQKALCEYSKYQPRVSAAARYNLQITGRALILEDSAPERKLLEMWLARLGLTVISVATIEDARQKFETGRKFSLAMIDAMIGGEISTALVERVIALGNAPPIIGMSADEEDCSQPMLAAGVNMFLPKPMNEEDTIRAIATVMGVACRTDAQGEPIHSSLIGDTDMGPLITEFVQSMDKYIGALQHYVQKHDVKAIGMLCHQLKGAGGSYGFEILSDSAKLVSDEIKRNEKNLNSIRRQVEQLINVASRLRED